MGLIFSLLNVALARGVSFHILHGLTEPSFVFHSSLLTAKSIDLAVLHMLVSFCFGNRL